MWIGIDDTDGPDGGCTTHVMTEVVARAAQAGFDLLGVPRLVRLDPNVPWKTRGNGALGARFGHGRGPRRRVGAVDGVPVWSYPRGAPLDRPEAAKLFRIARECVERLASRDRRTDPALVAAPVRLRAEIYREAVSRPLRLNEVLRGFRSRGGRAWTRSGRRGLVGAAAAIAWPGRRRTFEVLAYRSPQRVGSPRSIDRDSVRRAARRWPTLFLCEDPRTRRLLIAPHTRCPILFGLRSRDPRSLRPALAAIRSEPVERWMIFESNQGTGDHLRPRPDAPWPPYESGRVRGIVTGMPVTGRGGHVRFSIRTGGGRRVDCIAFEPTKELPRVAAALVPGDRVEVAGGRSRSGPVRLERLQIETLTPRFARAQPPRCAGCGRASSSIGRNRGYRCPGCGARFPPETALRAPLPTRFGPGVYDPTPSARRHLHPLPGFVLPAR